MSDPTTIVERLTAVIADHEGDVRQVDRLLERLPVPLPPDLVGPLLLSLVDDHPHEEVLWSVLHTAEAAGPGGAYEAGLVEAFARLADAAPSWARTALLRCMNSDPSVRSLVSALTHASQAQANAVQRVAQQLARDGPARFGVAATELMTAAKGAGS